MAYTHETPSFLALGSSPCPLRAARGLGRASGVRGGPEAAGTAATAAATATRGGEGRDREVHTGAERGPAGQGQRDPRRTRPARASGLRHARALHAGGRGAPGPGVGGGARAPRRG